MYHVCAAARCLTKHVGTAICISLTVLKSLFNHSPSEFSAPAGSSHWQLIGPQALTQVTHLYTVCSWTEGVQLHMSSKVSMRLLKFTALKLPCEQQDLAVTIVWMGGGWAAAGPAGPVSSLGELLTVRRVVREWLRGRHGWRRRLRSGDVAGGAGWTAFCVLAATSGCPFFFLDVAM